LVSLYITFLYILLNRIIVNKFFTCLTSNLVAQTNTLSVCSREGIWGEDKKVVIFGGSDGIRLGYHSGLLVALCRRLGNQFFIESDIRVLKVGSSPVKATFGKA